MSELVYRQMDGLLSPDILRPMDSEEFMRVGAGVLQRVYELERASGMPEVSADERAAASASVSAAIWVGNAALDRVVLADDAQRVSDNAVRMLRAAGDTPDRLRKMWDAGRVAALYGRVGEQLARDPRSPVLSVFANEFHVDIHQGVTVQAAYADGEATWRSDPFRDAGGSPEVLIGVHDWLRPSLSRSREQAIRDVRYSKADPSILDRPDNELAVVAGDWCTLLTDEYDPPRLILPVNGEEGAEYDDMLEEELAFEARMPSHVHMLAVGEAAVGRLVARIDAELVPVYQGSAMGVLEAKRLRANIDAALTALGGSARPVSVGPDRNLRYDSEAAIVTSLRDMLAVAGVASESYEGVYTMVSRCLKRSIDLDAGRLTGEVVGALAERHADARVTRDELASAVREYVDEILDPALYMHNGTIG